MRVPQYHGGSRDVPLCHGSGDTPSQYHGRPGDVPLCHRSGDISPQYHGVPGDFTRPSSWPLQYDTRPHVTRFQLSRFPTSAARAGLPLAHTASVAPYPLCRASSFFDVRGRTEPYSEWSVGRPLAHAVDDLMPRMTAYFASGPVGQQGPVDQQNIGRSMMRPGSRGVLWSTPARGQAQRYSLPGHWHQMRHETF